MSIRSSLYCSALLFAIPMSSLALDPQPLDGLWRGTFDINNQGNYDFSALYIGEEVAAWSVDTNVVYRGTVVGDDKTYQSNMVMYIRDGSMFGTVELNGIVGNDSTSIVAQYLTTGDDRGTLGLIYQPLFEQPVSLPDLKGLWESSGTKIDLSINLDDAGKIEGTDNINCNYYGQLSQIRPGINALSVTLELASCSTADGHYKGMAYIEHGKDANYTLHLSITSDYFGIYYPLRKILSKP